MKLQKPTFAAVALLAAFSLFAPGAAAQTTEQTVDSTLDKTLFFQFVFASSYVTLSATSEVNGHVWSGAATTAGANAAVGGNIVSVAATTLGAGVTTTGNVNSGAATTLGAGAIIDGKVVSGGATTIGAGAVIKKLERAHSPAPDIQDLFDAQLNLGGLAPDKVLLPGSIAADVTYDAGVHKITGMLSVAAGTTITLDADEGVGNDFIFNISSYLSFGAGVNVIILNAKPTTRVIWNVTGTYISIGADSHIKGLLLANTYVATGANSTVTSAVSPIAGSNPICGAFSATSYVVAGAGAKIN